MNRAGIYVYYDKDGILEDYAVCFINSLAKVCNYLTVVINGKLNPDEKEKIKNDKVKFIIRDNTGYDFWGYREGFLDFSREKLKQIDEMVFANSSFFGPVFPIENIFQTMKDKNVDFWGISKHKAVNKNVIKFNPETKIKEHIQTYFFVVRNKMLNSKEFYGYFLNLKRVKNKKEAIGFIEVSFTEHFKKSGFKFDAFIDDSILKYGIDNYHQYLPYLCMKNYGCPFIKKTAFGARYDLAQRETLSRESGLAFNFIKDETEYDIKLIVKEISKNYPADDIKRFLHLNFIIENKETFPSQKAAVLYDKDIIKNHKTDFYKLEEKRTVKQIKELSKSYDYILIQKTGDEKLNPYKKESYLEYLKDSMYKNIEGVMEIFTQNPYIGALYPLPYFIGDFKFLKFNNSVNGYFDAVPFFVWIKKEVAEKFDEKENVDSCTKLISLVQKSGYLCASVCSPVYNRIYLDNFEYKFLNSNDFLSALAFKAGKKRGV